MSSTDHVSIWDRAIYRLAQGHSWASRRPVSTPARAVNIRRDGQRALLAAVAAALLTGQGTFDLVVGNGALMIVAGIAAYVAAVLFLVSVVFDLRALRTRAWLAGWDEALSILAPDISPARARSLHDGRAPHAGGGS